MRRSPFDSFPVRQPEGIDKRKLRRGRRLHCRVVAVIGKDNIARSGFGKRGTSSLGTDALGTSRRHPSRSIDAFPACLEDLVVAPWKHSRW